MIEDKSYGVVALCEDKFLLLKQNKGHWGFPKGHKEGQETDREAASRELQEEAGITKCTLLDFPPISEEYFLVAEDKADWHKTVYYFVGLVLDNTVKIQESEISEYKWLPYAEAFALLTHDGTKEVLKKAKEYLDARKI